jgi:hypothetical protein
VFHSAGGVYDHLKAGDERRPEDERTAVRFAPPDAGDDARTKLARGTTDHRRKQ